uniref:Beta-glucuronidase n=1 Tax=Timema poppense TaxID=170557 RepID=A0A7R9CP73_TIMPO|nr:unnamed protein product [Timema poppensis]
MLVTLVVWGMFLGSLLPASGQEGPVGILYPRESESREVHSLDGVWNFRLSPVNDTAKGFTDEWYSQELRKSGDVIPMPVPASYNDITQDPEVRDFVGVVWYDRNFYVPSSWEGKRVWLRFGSVTYLAIVFVNGEHAVTHEIGHLPFKVEVTDRVNYGANNLITVAVNNTLYESSIPQGGVTNITTDQNTTEIFMTYSFDFFHYAGIDRPVTLYTTPEVYIDDISVITNIESQTGLVEYTIVYAGDSGDTDDLSISLILYDRDDQIVATSSGAKGELRIPDVNLWWPYLMHPDPAYLYTLQVNLTLEESDIYRLPVGVRTVSWNSTSLLINDKPFYFRGFGKHEDSDFKGKGLDLSIVTRDYNLIKWVGGNGYRTSHYPYAEEIMDFSDRQGIVIIDEVPIVDAKDWHEQLLENHLSSLTQLIQRDKNRPSVILWSVANEAATSSSGAEIYFNSSYQCTHASFQAQYSDVISVNTYSGWYSNTGQLHAITNNVLDRIRGFHSMHDKPVLVTEYGADAFSGLHVASTESMETRRAYSPVNVNLKGFVILLLPSPIFAQGGILYPQESESRDVQSLDGIWNFRISSMGDPGQGFDEEWYSHELRKTGNVAPMPVPSSYNHITVDRIVRDFVGVVWYDRIFYVPSPWLGQRVWLRFDSAHYSAYVYVNGVHVVSHDIGHLPFLVEVTNVVNYGSSNLLTVAVNNTLTRLVNYSVSVAGLEESGDDLTLTVSLYDKEGELVASSSRQEGLLEVPDANLWWPYLMDPNPGYLYTLEFRGRGYDESVLVKDYNVIKWIGGNGYRTSNYPPSEEFLDYADQLGIVVIDECPIANARFLTNGLLRNHKTSLSELIKRDKNHPSVIMWSLASGATTDLNNTASYFELV